MSRTLADKTTVRTLAVVLACTGCASAGVFGSAASASGNTGAAGGTGGAGESVGAALDTSLSANTGGASPSASSHKARASASHRRARGRGAASASGSQVATWFGPGFYGQKTACGQTLTPAVVGVASRTLPCGTLVLIDYKGRHLTVPVIDRGPYAHNGATWDLTWGAASALSIEDTVTIETKVVGRAANTPLLGAPAEPQPIAGAAVAPAG